MILIRKLLNWTGFLQCGQNMDHQWEKVGETFNFDNYQCSVCDDAQQAPTGFAPDVRG